MSYAIPGGTGKCLAGLLRNLEYFHLLHSKRKGIGNHNGISISALPSPLCKHKKKKKKKGNFCYSLGNEGGKKASNLIFSKRKKKKKKNRTITDIKKFWS